MIRYLRGHLSISRSMIYNTGQVNCTSKTRSTPLQVLCSLMNGRHCRFYRNNTLPDKRRVSKEPIQYWHNDWPGKSLNLNPYSHELLHGNVIAQVSQVKPWGTLWSLQVDSEFTYTNKSIHVNCNLVKLTLRNSGSMLTGWFHKISL